MTTSLNALRYLDLPVEAFVDLADGYLQLINNMDEWWSVGVIFETPREADEALAEQMSENGMRIIWINEIQAINLSRGHRLELIDDRGGRYLITVLDVEQLDSILSDRQAAREEQE